MEQPDYVISLSNISKSFVKIGADIQVVDAVEKMSLEIRRGSFNVFLGPSGCGKSTVMNMISGVIRPTEGKVHYDSCEVSTINTNVGYLTQTDTTLPWRSVLRNVSLPLEIRGMGNAQSRRAAAQAMIETVGLAGFESHYPSELSGGMRRRLALATVLVYEPDTLLLDEPFGSLDAQTKLLMQEELLRIWRQTGKKTIVFVTHDLDEALFLADEIMVFSRSPGRIIMNRRVPLARPRSSSAARTDPKVAALREEIWDALRGEMQSAEGPIWRSAE